MSELGFVYFLARTATMKVLSVYTPGYRSQNHLLIWCPWCMLTSRACKSATPCGFLSAATARENSCRVWSWRCNKSLGPISSRICRSDGRSGRRRKNSVQKPSDLSPSSASSYPPAGHKISGRCTVSFGRASHYMPGWRKLLVVWHCVSGRDANLEITSRQRLSNSVAMQSCQRVQDAL